MTAVLKSEGMVLDVSDWLRMLVIVRRRTLRGGFKCFFVCLFLERSLAGTTTRSSTKVLRTI